MGQEANKWDADVALLCNVLGRKSFKGYRVGDTSSLQTDRKLALKMHQTLKPQKQCEFNGTECSQTLPHQRFIVLVI